MKCDSSRAGMEKAFNAWHKEVIEKCPKDKLLVFDVKEGWEPLCKFLNKPIPDVPFPNTNDTAQMIELHKVCNRYGWAFFGMAVSVVTGLVYLAASKIHK